jgi:hypothetical protein
VRCESGGCAETSRPQQCWRGARDAGLGLGMEGTRQARRRPPLQARRAARHGDVRRRTASSRAAAPSRQRHLRSPAGISARRRAIQIAAPPRRHLRRPDSHNRSAQATAAYLVLRRFKAGQRSSGEMPVRQSVSDLSFSTPPAGTTCGPETRQQVAEHRSKRQILTSPPLRHHLCGTAALMADGRAGRRAAPGRRGGHVEAPARAHLFPRSRAASHA